MQKCPNSPYSRSSIPANLDSSDSGPEVLGLYWKRPQGNPRGLIGVDVGALSIQRLEGSRWCDGRYGS